MGVIVRLEKENFRILTMQGKIQNMSHQSVTKKRPNKFAAALDSEGKTVSQADIVKVVEGVHKGQQGQVKYIYRHFAFIFSKTFPENGGYFVCTTRQLLMSSSNGRPAAALQQPAGSLTPGFMSPRVLASPMHPSAAGASSHRSAGNSSQHGSTTGKSPAAQSRPQSAKPGTRRNTGLIGKTVRITQGPYKGYVGIVKDATDTTARVELHTKCQTISVDLVRLTVVDSAKVFGRTPGGSFATPVQHGGQTPVVGSRTPLYGSQTPMHDGSRTPHYGGATPRYDGGATPSDRHSSAWDPTSTVTPRNDFEDDWDEQPPSASLNPTTPGYQVEIRAFLFTECRRQFQIGFRVVWYRHYIRYQADF
jgi:transcription elongation factor SPT5